MDILDDYRRWRRQFLDEDGRLKAQLPPGPDGRLFMRESSTAQRMRAHIPVPKGPVEVW